ncbi:MAG TPA: hypothetical protein VFA11_13115 [Acidimicrobiales bacterium]|nr:hypothetical protein [Acidimicrobiales bacterium]
MRWAIGGGSGFVLLVMAVALLRLRAKRRVRPMPAPRAHTGVRLLEGPADVADAVERAVRSERLAARQISGRLARYEDMSRETGLVALPMTRSQVDSA